MLVLSNIDRAGDHILVLGAVILVAAVGGLVRTVVRSRAGRGPQG